MKYPLIILGAGASYDFQDLREYNPQEEYERKKWQPPLTNKLFDGSKFEEILNSYPQLNEIVGDIRPKLRNSSNTKTFEEIISSYYQKRNNNKEISVGLVAMLFYINELLTKVSDKYYSDRNNYSSLILKLKNSSLNAIFVNFNYDLLLEKTLGLERFNSFDGYIHNQRFPVIKIHGSCNWYWQIMTKPLRYDETNYTNAIANATSIIENLRGKASWTQVVITKSGMKDDVIDGDNYMEPSYLPCLALPMGEKDFVVCPDKHIEFLKQKIKDVDGILMIGWKAGDKYLCELLEMELKSRAIPITFVGGSNASKTINSLPKLIRENIKYSHDGFSDYIGSNEAEDFFLN
jgi:hypothetical protein